MLKKRLKEEKLRLQRHVKLTLNNYGELAVLDNLKDDSIFLSVEDIQKLIVYLILSSQSPHKPDKWCELKKGNLLKKIAIIFVRNFSLEDYQENRYLFDETLNNFDTKVKFSCENHAFHLVEDVIMIPLTNNEQFSLRKQYGNLETAVSFNNSLKQVKNGCHVSANDVKGATTNNEQLGDQFSRVQLMLSFSQMVADNYPLSVSNGGNRYFKRFFFEIIF